MPIKLICDCCGEEVPQNFADEDLQLQGNKVFVKLRCIPGDDSEREVVCRKCLFKIGLEVMKEEVEEDD